MKKLLILLLLSVTTIFTQISASGFILGTVSYDNVSFSVTNQESVPLGIAFNDDGSKMYVVGFGSKSIQQYSLSTNFNLNTASYDNVSFDLTSQDNDPQSLRFNNDGTKMYVIGLGNDSVYQYSLSTPYNVGTASYDSVSFSFSSQDNNSRDVRFNDNGTKMYIIGLANNTVYQYSLSTAFNLSTASYDSVSFNFGSQENLALGFSFNNDGTKMFIVGDQNDTIYQYGLSTAFNVGTASYDSVSFGVGSQESIPRGIAFSNNGNKIFIIGSNTDSIYQYTNTFQIFNYPAEINLDSNYGDYFDEDIQFQDQDELYIDYPISAQSADVNDDWQATAPTSGIGSFVFQDWYDLDNNVVFSTNASLSITNPARDYNLRARYTGVTEYDLTFINEIANAPNFQYQGTTFANNTIGIFSNNISQTVPDGTDWFINAPNIAGYSFDHWYDLDNNVIFTTSQDIDTFLDQLSTSRDYNLEARYSPIPTYTFNAVSDLPSPPDFQYQVNSGTTQNAYPVDITVNEGDDLQITAPTTGIGFYEFDGWYNTSDNSFIQSGATLQYSNITQNISIEARYTLPEEYQIDLTLTSQIGNIQFQIDDNTPIFAPSISETIFAGQDFQATGPSDPSYEFQHWFDLDNNVVFSENLFITAQDVDRDYNLEARYLEIFDITFDTAGGDPINADTATDGEAYALPTPTREGFIFLGWNDSNDVLPRPIIESPYTITEDVEFIANWVEVITINFNSNGGTAVDAQNVSAGGVVTQPVTPAKFGYIFDGWYTDNNTFSNEYDFNSSVNTAFTLHAKWILGSDSDVGETLNTWIADSGISAIFIVLVIMVAVTVTLGLINAQMFVIIISNLSIIFVFTALGFIPVWIVLVSGLALIGFIIMTVFGGSNNA